MKKSYLLIAIALVATLLLGACGTPTEAPVVTEPPVVEEPVVEEPVVEEPTEAPTEAPVEEPVATLRIWADEQRASGSE
jgi:outer membrane biogenesis lipoprotein LolB